MADSNTNTNTQQDDNQLLKNALLKYLLGILTDNISPVEQKKVRDHIQRLGINRVDDTFSILMEDKGSLLQKNSLMKKYVQNVWEQEKEILKTKESLFIPLSEDINNLSDRLADKSAEYTEMEKKQEQLKHLDMSEISSQKIFSMGKTSYTKEDVLSFYNKYKDEQMRKDVEKIKKAEAQIKQMQAEIKQIMQAEAERNKVSENNTAKAQEVNEANKYPKTAEINDNSQSVHIEVQNTKPAETNKEAINNQQTVEVSTDNPTIRASINRKNEDITQTIGSCYNKQEEEICDFVQNKNNMTGLEQTVVSFGDDDVVIRRINGKTINLIDNKGRLNCNQLDKAGQYVSEIGRKIKAGEDIKDEDLKKANELSNKGKQGVILTILYPEQSKAITKLAQDRGLYIVDTNNAKETPKRESSEEFILDALLKDGNLSKEQENKLLEISVEIEQQRLNPENKKGNYAEQFIDKIIKSDILDKKQKVVALNAAIEAEKIENKQQQLTQNLIKGKTR